MADRPALLVVASTFPRWQGDIEPRFVEYLSYELAERFEVVVLAPHCPGAALDEVFSDGDRSIAVHRFRYFIPALQSLAYEGGILARLRRNPLRICLVPFYLLAQLLSIANLQRRHGFDAIHAHWIIPQGLVVALLTKVLRKTPPWLVTSHGGDLYALRGRILTSLKGWVLGSADAISVVSNAMREYCVRHGVEPERIVVQSMGVDLDQKFTPGDAKVARRGLVFIGRLVDKKGVSHLIDAMVILNKRYPNLNLQVVGDGPLRESLVDQARDGGVSDSIAFVGSVANDDVPRYLRSASIAVMPSVVAPSGDQEGLGLVAVEAMGCGCAVVASDLPAVRDTVKDGVTGLMARPGDGVDLARQIARILDDDRLRKALADSGRRHAIENFNWRAVGSSYARIINDMISASQPS